MHPLALRALTTAFAIASATLAAQAQTTPPPPPIKPGLWQVQIDREVNGQKMPDASERMKNMSPEKRAQFEAMMKQHRQSGLLYARDARAFSLG
jgi:Spy/CpxP family protein refolding chaperone